MTTLAHRQQRHSAEPRRLFAPSHDFVSFAGLREEPIDIRTITRHYKLTPKKVPPQ
jgi:hypothetical protein